MKLIPVRVLPTTSVLIAAAVFISGALAAQSTHDPKKVERIHAAKMPAVTAPILFDTPEADAIVAALEIFPPDNAWNQRVTDWPLHPDSRVPRTADGAASIPNRTNR